MKMTFFKQIPAKDEYYAVHSMNGLLILDKGFVRLYAHFGVHAWS